MTDLTSEGQASQAELYQAVRELILATGLWKTGADEDRFAKEFGWALSSGARDLPWSKSWDQLEPAEAGQFQRLFETRRDPLRQLLDDWELLGRGAYHVAEEFEVPFLQEISPTTRGLRPLLGRMEVERAIERVSHLFDPLAGPLDDLFQMPDVERSLAPAPRPVLRTSGHRVAPEERAPGAGDRFFPPHLKVLNHRLRRALEAEDPVAVCHALAENFDYLVSFFAAVLGGALDHLGESPEDQATEGDFGEWLGVLTECRRGLESHAGQPIADSLLRALPDEVIAWLERRSGQQDLKAWIEEAFEKVADEEPARCAELSAQGMTLLTLWLQEAKSFFGSWDVFIRVRHDFNLEMRLARGDQAFDARPYVDPERYGVRLSSKQLSDSRIDPDWAPAPALTEEDLRKLVAPPDDPDDPVPLRKLLTRLRGSLAHGDPLTCGRDLFACFDFLLRYHTSLATGALRSIAPFPLEAALSESRSLLHCNKLLHYSFGAFQAYPQHPVTRALKWVFFDDEQPRRVTRWLGLAGSPVDGLENLSAWHLLLGRPDVHQRFDELMTSIEVYHQLLCEWVDCSRAVFSEVSHDYEILSAGHRLGVVFDLGEGLRFRGVPDLLLDEPMLPSIDEPPAAPGPQADYEEWEQALEEELSSPIFNTDIEMAAAAVSAEPIPSMFDLEEEVAGGWSEAEVDQISRHCQALSFAGPESRPKAMADRVAHFLKNRVSGQIWVRGAEGSGKTLLSRSLANPRSSPLADGFPVVHFLVADRLETDFNLFMEMLNEHIRRQRSLREIQFRGLDVEVLFQINLRYNDPPQRFFAYLSALRQVNQGRDYLLIVDGADEGVMDLVRFLPPEVPDGVFLMVTVAENYPIPRVEGDYEEIVFSLDEPDFLTLLHQHAAPVEWQGADVEAAFKKVDGRLTLLHLARDGAGHGFFENFKELPALEEWFPTFLEMLKARFPQTERFQEVQEFLGLLAAFDRPFPLDKLRTSGCDPQVVWQMIDEFPAAFSFWAEDEPVIGLAHPWFAENIRRHLPDQFARGCRSLVTWFLDNGDRHELPRAPWWAMLSDDRELLARFFNHDRVLELRDRVMSQAEAGRRFHLQVELLDGWCEASEALVESRTEADDYLSVAWAYSRRGRSYLALGQLERARRDLGKAHSAYRFVQHQKQLAPGSELFDTEMATAELHLHLEEWEKAGALLEQLLDHLDDAQGQAQVETPTNREIRVRALKLRGDLTRIGGHRDEALRFYTEAAGLLQDEPGASPELLCRLWTSHAALLIKLREFEAAANLDTQAIELLTETVAEERGGDFRVDLARAFNDRATALHRLNQQDEALEDYEQSIAIRQRLLDEGRLDVREDLASSFTNRGLIRSQADDTRGALDDFQGALDLRERLVMHEGRADLRGALAFTHLCRGTTFAGLRSHQLAREELSAAAEHYQILREHDQASEIELREQAQAYGALASVEVAEDEHEAACGFCEQALRVYQELEQASTGEETDQALAILLTNYGRALRGTQKETSARKAFAKALDHYSRLVREHRRHDLVEEKLEVVRLLCRLYLDDGELEAALNLWTEVEQEHGQDNQTFATSHLAYTIYSEAGEHAQALNHLVAALGFLEPSRDRDQYLSLSLERVRLHEHLGERAQARQELTALVDQVWEQYQEPGGERYQELLALVRLERARLTLLDREFAQAVDYLGEAFATGVNREHEGLAQLVDGLVAELTRAAEQAAGGGEPEVALDLWTQIIELGNKFRDWDSAQEYGPMLLKAYRRRGLLHQSAELNEEGLNDLTRSVEVCSVLVYLEGHDELSSELAVSLVHRARLQLALGRPELAGLDFGRAVELLSPLVKHSAKPELERFLAITLFERASLAHQRGAPDVVLGDLIWATRLMRAQSSKLDRSGKLALARAYRCLADSLLGVGYRDQAEADFARAVNMYRELGSRDVDLELFGSLLQWADLAKPAAAVASLMEALDFLVDHPEWAPRFPQELFHRAGTSHAEGARRLLGFWFEVVSGNLEALAPQFVSWLATLESVLQAAGEAPQGDHVIQVMEKIADLCPPEERPRLARLLVRFEQGG